MPFFSQKFGQLEPVSKMLKIISGKQAVEECQFCTSIHRVRALREVQVLVIDMVKVLILPIAHIESFFCELFIYLGYTWQK